MNTPREITQELINELCKACRVPSFRIAVLRKEPCPVILIAGSMVGNVLEHLLFPLEYLATKVFKCADDSNPNVFRSVGIDRMTQIMASGCDVCPTDASFFPGNLQKSIEYGGHNKVILLFDRTRLERTHKVIAADTDPKLLEEARKTFPTCVPLEDGKSLWFSRIPSNDPTVNSTYEETWGYFIPGDPWQALLAIFLVGSDPIELRKSFEVSRDKGQLRELVA